MEFKWYFYVANYVPVYGHVFQNVPWVFSTMNSTLYFIIIWEIIELVNYIQIWFRIVLKIQLLEIKRVFVFNACLVCHIAIRST